MIAFWIFALLLLSSLRVEAKFKSLHCTNFDRSYGDFTTCKITAINRYRNSMSVVFQLIKTVENAQIRFQIFKRANGWRPFLYDITVNLCDFLKGKNNLIVGLAFEYLKPYMELGNLKCPFKKHDFLNCTNFEVDLNKLRIRFPIETGEYATQLSFIIRKKVTAAINGSAEYYNYREH